jgi:DNA-binding protein YbaB
MAKPNFQFQKRQKELEKKKKNEEKVQRKLERSTEGLAQEEDPSEIEGGDVEVKAP